MEQKAVLELSKLIHEVNLLFADISEHRTLTLASRGELETVNERRAFEAYNYYALDASRFLKKCERRGKLNCRLPKPGAIPWVEWLRSTINQIVKDDSALLFVKKDILQSLLPYQSKKISNGFGSTCASICAST